MNDIIKTIPIYPVEIDTIYVDKRVKNTTIVHNVQSNIKKYACYQNTKWIEIDDYHDIIRKFPPKPETFLDDKKTILIYPEQGKHFHHCPGSDGVLCCRYFVFDFGMNCPYDCDYCYLQSYLSSSLITVAGNLDELLESAGSKVKENPGIRWRIGTGEYMDSLALDFLTDSASIVARYFADIENCTMEFKTKSTHIHNLLEQNIQRNSVLSWSLNTEYLINSVESMTPSLNDRLSAALFAVKSGFRVGFHFDPLIFYENWENDYTQLITKLAETIPSEKICWISIGTFRYSQGLKEFLRVKKWNEFITKGEMLYYPDKKFRYYYPLRKKMYKKMYQEITNQFKDVPLYLCMESRSIWKDVFGYTPEGPAELDRKFHARLDTT